MIKFLGAAVLTAVVSIFGIKSQLVQPSASTPVIQPSKNTNCLSSGVCFDNRVLLIKDSTDRNIIPSDDSYIDTTKIINYYSQNIKKSADFLVVFKDWDIPPSAPEGFEITLNQTDTGMGIHSQTDTKNSLKILVSMPNIKKLSIENFPGDTGTFNAQIYTLAHEIGHYWLAYHYNPSLNISDPNASFHYNTCIVFNTGNIGDLMISGYVNFQKKSDGIFTAFPPDNNPYNKKFSNLSLYVMGLLPSSQVKPFQIIQNNSNSCVTSSQYANGVYTITGSTTQISLSDLTKVYGERTPKFPNTQKKFTVQIALLTHENSQLSQSDADVFSKYLDAVEKYLPFAFSQKASFTLLKNTSISSNQNTDLLTYSGSTDTGLNFSLKYPSSWTYYKFSCNADGVAFWPKNSAPDTSKGGGCSMNGFLNSAPITLSTMSQPVLNLIDKNFIDTYNQMKISLSRHF